MNELLGNLDELVSQVRRRAEQRAMVIERRAAADADEVERSATGAAAAAAAEVEAAGAHAAAAARRSRLAEADQSHRRRRLEAREARLERVFEAAAHELARRGVPRTALAPLARDAASRLGAEEVVIRVDAPSLATLTPEQVAAWADPDGPVLTLDDQPLRDGHGVVALAGRRSVDATLEARLAVARERLREVVDALLRGDRTDPGAHADAELPP